MKSAIGHQMKNVNDKKLVSNIRWQIANEIKTHKLTTKNRPKKAFFDVSETVVFIFYIFVEKIDFELVMWFVRVAYSFVCSK